jgi:hypothetical protein
LAALAGADFLAGAFFAGAFSATGAAWKIATGITAAFLAGLVFFSSGLAVSTLADPVFGTTGVVSGLTSALTLGVFLAARLRGFFGAIAISSNPKCTH